MPYDKLKYDNIASPIEIRKVEKNRLLNENEIVIWKGRPSNTGYILYWLPYTIIPVFLWMTFWAVYAVQVTDHGEIDNLLLPTSCLVIGLGGLIKITYEWLTCCYLYYFVTDKRVISFRKNKKRSMSVRLAEIIKIEVEEPLFGYTASIKIVTGYFKAPDSDGEHKLTLVGLADHKNALTKIEEGIMRCRQHG